MAKKKKDDTAPQFRKDDSKPEKKATRSDGTNSFDPSSASGWLKRISRAKKYRDQIKDKQGWDTNLEAYEGDYKINSQIVKSPPINIVFGYVDTGIAKMYARDPYFSVNAGRGNTIERAHLLEKVVNWLKKEIKLKGEVERVLRDTYIASMGWIKVGFAGEIGEKPVDTDDETKGMAETVDKGEVFAKFVPWEDILFDVTLCSDPPYDCPWIAHRIVKPLQDWKDSKLYEWPEDIKPNLSTLSPDGKKVDEKLKDADTDLFEVWEIHDTVTNKIYAVAEGVDKFGRDDENMAEMKGLPFVALKFNPIPKKPYPLADITIIMPQILERIKLRGGMLNHIKRWSRQMTVEKGSHAPEEIDKFTNGIDGAVIQREKGSAPPTPIEYAALQSEIFVLDQLIQKDMDTVIGQNEVDRGAPAPGGGKKTKYELQEQQQGSASRNQKRQDKLEDFLGEVASKLVALMKQFYDTPRYVAITGMTVAEVVDKMGLKTDNVEPGGVVFTKEDIQGEFDIEVKAGTTLPLNKENRIKASQGILEMIKDSGIQPGNPLQIAVIGEILRELDLQEAIKAFDQMKEQMKTAPGPQAGPGTLPPGGPVAPAVQPPPGPPLPGGAQIPRPQ
jgi:ribosomal protein L12E/L44/L45/RPP1/RPP2